MSDLDLNKGSLFAPLGKEMEQYYGWFTSNPPPAVPKEVIYQGAGTEVQMPFIHLAVCAPTYVIAGRYIRELEERLGWPVRVLEIGCGAGIGAYYLKTQVAPDADISGIDFSPEAIAYAQKHYGEAGVEYMAEKAQRLPFENEQFDVVLSVQVLEHIPREGAVQFVRGVGRVLRRGGLAIISTPNRELCQDLYCDNPNDNDDRRLISSHEHEYYKDELELLFKDAAQDGKLFEEVQVNAQINQPYRRLCVRRFTPGGGVLGNLKRIYSNFSRRLVPVNIQNWLGRRSWEILMKVARVSYQDLARENEYHQGTDDVKADQFFVVAKK